MKRRGGQWPGQCAAQWAPPPKNCTRDHRPRPTVHEIQCQNEGIEGKKIERANPRAQEELDVFYFHWRCLDCAEEATVPVGSQFEVHVLRTAQCGHLAGGESGQMASATAPVRGHKRVTGWVTLPKSGPPSAFKLHDFDSLQRKKTEPKLDPDPTRLDTVPNQAHREFLPAVLTSPASPFRNPTLDPNIRSLYFPYHHTQHTPPQ